MSGYKEIPVKPGLVAKVDEADYDALSRFKWYAHKRSDGNGYYARGYMGYFGGRTKYQSMHRLLMNAGKGRQVDHVNGDGLDNRRSNLRLCNRFENRRNNEHRVGKSGYRGVYQQREKDRWAAKVCLAGKMRTLGVFLSAEAAAMARDEAVRQTYGAFGRYNFPKEGERPVHTPRTTGNPGHAAE